MRYLLFVGMAPDSRVTKEMLALVFALSIGLLAVFEGTLKPFRNKFFLIIPVYLLLNLIMSPHYDLNINNNEVGDFYFWKPFGMVMCFTFMIVAISSMETEWNSILKIMVICGTVMAGYVVLQKFGFDQFWLPKTEGQFTSVRSQLLGGNLGQPTIVASWIVMMIPLAIYLRKWWMTALMVVACLLTQGAMVIGAIMMMGMIYGIKFNKIFIIPVIMVLVLGIVWMIAHSSYVSSRMDGRSKAWSDTLHDIKYGQMDDKHRFPFTGVGFGRFSFVAPARHNSMFQQVHNDSLEFAWDCGLIGEYLLLAGIFIMILFAIKSASYMIFSIALSFLAVFFCSLGSFPFQLGAHQFYASILVGLLHNEKLLRRV